MMQLICRAGSEDDPDFEEFTEDIEEDFVGESSETDDEGEDLNEVG